MDVLLADLRAYAHATSIQNETPEATLRNADFLSSGSDWPRNATYNSGLLSSVVIAGFCPAVNQRVGSFVRVPERFRKSPG